MTFQEIGKLPLESESASIQLTVPVTKALTSPVKLLAVEPLGILEGIGLVNYIGFAGGPNKVPAVDIHLFLNQSAVDSMGGHGWPLSRLSNQVRDSLEQALSAKIVVWQSTPNPNKDYDPFDKSCGAPAGFNANRPIEGQEPVVGGYGHLVYSIRLENIQRKEDKVIASCLDVVRGIEESLLKSAIPKRPALTVQQE